MWQSLPIFPPGQASYVRLQQQEMSASTDQRLIPSEAGENAKTGELFDH